MRVEPIRNGVVIDHIKAGRAMQIYNTLGLDKLDCPVAILRNVPSARMGRKDVIKIDRDGVALNFDVLGFLSPQSTVDIIRDGAVAEKNHIGLPPRLEGILRCGNPRCITTTEQEIRHIFRLTDAERGVYRCVYCDARAST